MTDGPPDVWEIGAKYDEYIGRWSRRLAPAFLQWLSAPPRQRWLDVGCGTGALSAAILEECEPTSLDAVEPSAGFLDAARRRLGGAVTFHLGDATRLPLEDASVDVAVSGLVLNFVSDQRAAVSEMARVVRPGGKVAAYVWDYAGEMQLIRLFWDVAVELDPRASELDEGNRFPSCQPEPLRQLFAAAALSSIEVTAIDIPTPFGSFGKYWHPFTGGQGPAPSYAMALGDAERRRLRDRLEQRVPTLSDGSISLKARAWAVQGTNGRTV